MELTTALLNALRSMAGAEVKSIAQTSATRIVLTHATGAQLSIDALALSAHIQGDPGRLAAEARGALAALTRIAAQAQQPRDAAGVRDRIVPVLRPAAWLAAAKAQTGRELTAEGLAHPFGRALSITFAIEYDDQRVPVLAASELGGLAVDGAMSRALANQRRILDAGAEDLVATDLHMGDGTFFLRSKNLQAASLILQPFAWRLIERFAAPAPATVLGTVVGADALLFGPSVPGSLDTSAEMLRSARTGLRKSFGGDGDWGDDVFVFPRAAALPALLS